MISLTTPLRFVPFLRPMVWGGRSLSKLGKVLPSDEPYGESWELSDHALHRSVVAGGPLAGISLRQLMEQARQPLLGPAAAKYPTFPWLFKFLDCCDWLSVQVHPDESAVQRLWPGEGSKTEAWFVLEARPGSRIYAGLLPGVGPAEFRQAVEQGTVQECLHSFAPQAGQCIFLPAGTVHAVGGGVLLAEIQQTSDATFRLFDWNRCDAQGRTRKLHIEEGLASIAWTMGPVHPEQVPAAGPPCEQALVRCRYFHVDFVESAKPFVVGGMGGLQALAVLSGGGRFSGGEDIVSGQVWLLPAYMPKQELLPSSPTAFLRCTLPNE